MNEHLPGAAPSASMIGALLARQGIHVDAQALEQAVLQLRSTFTGDATAAWLRAALARAQVTEVGIAVVDLRRANPSLLPALAWCDGSWHMLDTKDQGEFVLHDVSGNTVHPQADALSTAMVVLFRPRASHAAEGGHRAVRLMLSEIFRDKGWLWKVALATIVVNLLAVASSLYSMQVYDRVVPTLAWSTLVTLTAGMGLVVVLDAVLKASRSRILDSLACAVDRRASQQVFEHLLYSALDERPRSVGTLAAQIGSLETIRQFFSSTVIFGLVDLPFALMFLAFIAVIGGKVAWVYALLLPVGLGLALFAHRRSQQLVRRQMTRSNERQGILVDAIRGAEAIRAANASWRFAQDWRDINDTVSAYAIQQKSIQGGVSIAIGVLSTLAYVAAIVVGVLEVEAGQLSTGGIVACSLLGGRVITPVLQGVQYLVQWEQVRQALQMIDQVLAIEPERRADQSLLSPSFATENLTLVAEQLRYGYTGSPLMQLRLPTALSLRAGDRVLVMGSVGSGKSTLLKILGGLYRPREGRVLLDGHDAWAIEPQVLASMVGYLPQDSHLFKGTLHSNLSLSGVTSDAQVAAICRDLGIDRISATHPLGMDLKISEGGGGLSGGQCQLVALGRLMINRPRVWLLDEPTAALDADSELRFWKTLEQQLRPEDILLVATHKPQLALRLANRVLLMKDGEIMRDAKPADIFQRGPAVPARSAGAAGAAGAAALVAAAAPSLEANHAL